MQTPKTEKGIIVDIGAGDGKFVYDLAKRYPERLFIGIDPNHKGLIKMSSKIYKKPARGGLDNVMFVLASVEDIPEELENIANQVYINFPWGSLLKSIVLVNKQAWKNIASIAKKGAFVDIVFGYDQETDRTEIERLKLPALNLEYIKNTMKPKLGQLGLSTVQLKEISQEELSEYPSSWAKKLRFSPQRTYFYMRLKKT